MCIRDRHATEPARADRGPEDAPVRVVRHRVRPGRSVQARRGRYGASRPWRTCCRAGHGCQYQHPRWPPSDRRTAAHRAGRDIRSSRAVIPTRFWGRRQEQDQLREWCQDGSRPPCEVADWCRPRRAWPDRPGRTRCQQRGVEHLLGRNERVQVLGRAVLAIHRRACTQSTSSSGANCATGTPLLRAKQRAQMPP